MSVFSAVGAFFENLWNEVLKPDVQEIEQVAVAFFSAAASAVANQLGATGLKIVTDAVVAAQNAGGTGMQKLAAAQAQVISDLNTAGITATSNVINAAIEGAVAQLHSINAPAVSPVVTPVAAQTPAAQ